MDANADKGIDGMLKLCCYCNAVFWNGQEQWAKLKLGAAQTLPSIFCAHRVDPDGQLSVSHYIQSLMEMNMVITYCTVGNIQKVGSPSRKHNFQLHLFNTAVTLTFNTQSKDGQNRIHEFAQKSIRSKIWF